MQREKYAFKKCPHPYASFNLTGSKGLEHIVHSQHYAPLVVI